MALSLGAAGVWIGTRFIASKESAAPQRHIDAVLAAKPVDTMRTLIYSGRPLRTMKTDYVLDWELNRKQEIEDLCNKGIVPLTADMRKAREAGKDIDLASIFPLLMGQGASAVKEVKSAREIVDEIVYDAAAITRHNSTLLTARL
jgi:NAD(P)H-dependent flavin oxidoreductase YrpB (nitropropane dioxygenase family)